MEKLPIELKEKWVAALRSGEYKQTDNGLYRNGAYCCLGVAGSLCGLTEIEMMDLAYLNGLPNVPDLLNVQGDNDHKSVAYILASMNDAGKSFETIADYIEANL